jgi:hypothetical protein
MENIFNNEYYFNTELFFPSYVSGSEFKALRNLFKINQSEIANAPILIRLKLSSWNNKF